MRTSYTHARVYTHASTSRGQEDEQQQEEEEEEQEKDLCADPAVWTARRFLLYARAYTVKRILYAR